MRFSRSFRSALPFILSSLALPVAAQQAGTCPEEPLVDNHSGPGTVVCPCFVPGEEAGAVFDVPAEHFPIEVLRIGIGWGSVFGGGPQVVEEAIHIYNGGLPNPGARVATLFAPQLTDGFINEYNLEPLPGEIIINAEPVAATLEFFNQNSGSLGPSVVHDGAGCQVGKNLVFAIPGGWSDACALGVTGNWLFHLVYRRVDCTGTNENYCVTSPNSVGPGSMISFLGTTSVSAQDLILTSQGNPTQQFGVFYYGPEQVQVPFGDGFACVGQGATGVFRFQPPVQTDVFGNAFLPVDYSSPPANSALGSLSAGSEWNFQWWYRDPQGMGVGFNLSDGLNLTFEP